MTRNLCDIYTNILCIRIYDTIRNYIDCKLGHINHSTSCDAFMFWKYGLIQLNYNRLHDFDHYEALQENYAELSIENHIIYIIYK